MRITSWNVNGILTINQYKPWRDLPDLEACLEHLQADIACFQETKITRKAALSQRQICLLDGFHSFFDFHPTRGYSGTVTYIRKSTCCPIKSETGLTGSILPLQVRSNPLHSIGSYPDRCEEDMDEAMFKSLDAEGRSVVTDCGMFVLFNLYCPNLTNEERSEFKMSFYLCLEERIRNLMAAGREVIVVGDLNIIRDAMDHCEPSEAIRAAKEAGLSSFSETTHPRKWLNSMLQPLGPLHDVGRELHPTRAKYYTCWDTLRNSRPQNYGSRLDYTLISPGIRPWVKSADIQADLMGSDHCPIFVDLYDEREIDGKLVQLRDLLSGGPEKSKAPLLPPLATSNWPEFKGNQKTIKDLFARASTQNKALAGGSASATPSNLESEKASILLDASTSSVLQSSQSHPSKSTSVGNSQSSSSQSSSLQGGGVLNSSTSSLKRPASSSASPSKGETSKKRKKAAGQQKLKSYFKKENPNPIEVEEEEEQQQQAAAATAAGSTQSSLKTSTQKSTAFSEAMPQDVLSALSEQPDSDRSFLSNSPSKEDKKKVSDQWSSLFQKPTPPKCTRHFEDATYWTVNKPGPNKGRGFWLCSRPVGEGYEREGRKNGSTEYRCNYFCWESERPKNKSKKAPAVASGSGSKK